MWRQEREIKSWCGTKSRKRKLEVCQARTEEICKLVHYVTASVIVIGIIMHLYIKVNVRDQEAQCDCT